VLIEVAVPKSIVDLWLAETLPIRSALYRADGTSIAVRFQPSVPGGLSLLEPFSLEAAMRVDPDYVTQIDTTVQQELSGDAGYLVCGYGSYGSEGFFGRLDSDKRLIWVVYLENCNPFISVSVESTFATFKSSSGVTITVDLETPEFGVQGRPAR
jgi:hypothetical protein